jgi:hypothetical protein
MDDFDISFMNLAPIFNVRSWEMAEFLVEKDAKTRDIVNAKGETPLDVARAKGLAYKSAVQFFEEELELERMDAQKRKRKD